MTDKLIIVMDSRPFLVDTFLDEFRQYNHLNNTIAFQALKQEGAFYTLELNCNQLRIPQEVVQQPETLSGWAQFGINVKSQEDHWGIFLGNEKLARRLSGELPHIDIAGTDFTVDWRLKELRESAKPWNKLDLRDMQLNREGEAYVCFYDTDTHEEFVPDKRLLATSENVVLLEIPNEVVLDPVAVAREYGVGETELLTRHPLAAGLSATVKPLSESGLAAFIQANRERAAGDRPRNKRGR